MRKRSKPTRKAEAESPEDVLIEPGADKRLANILKKALNTPPKHVPAKDKRAKK
jgi:hypothetical protein